MKKTDLWYYNVSHDYSISDVNGSCDYNEDLHGYMALPIGENPYDAVIAVAKSIVATFKNSEFTVSKLETTSKVMVLEEGDIDGEDNKTD